MDTSEQMNTNKKDSRKISFVFPSPDEIEWIDVRMYPIKKDIPITLSVPCEGPGKESFRFIITDRHTIESILDAFKRCDSLGEDESWSYFARLTTPVVHPAVLILFHYRGESNTECVNKVESFGIHHVTHSEEYPKQGLIRLASNAPFYKTRRSDSWHGFIPIVFNEEDSLCIWATVGLPSVEYFGFDNNPR